MANEYVESVAKRLLNQEVEVYFSTDFQTRLYSDYELHEKTIVRGILVETDECLLIVKTKSGALAYINSWGVTFITPAYTSVAQVIEPSKGGGRK